MNFVSPMLRSTTKPKLATTSGILYSRASAGSAKNTLIETEASYSGSTSPDSVAASSLNMLGVLSHQQYKGLSDRILEESNSSIPPPPPPPELPLYARNDPLFEGMELVTPCQSMLNNANRLHQVDLDGSFPLIQEFLAASNAAQGLRNHREGELSVEGEDSFGFGGAVIHNNKGGNQKVRANSLCSGGQDDSSITSSGCAGRGTASTTSVHNKKTQYHKTKLCPWHKEGKCFMGSVCNYAHSREELKPKPDLSKTKLCPEVVKHKTCDRPGCRFAHDFVELRATSTFFKTRLCKFWQRGYCPAGVDCRHAHGKEDLRMEQLAEAAALQRASLAAAAAAAAETGTGQSNPFDDKSINGPLSDMPKQADLLPNNNGSPSFMSTTAPTPVDASPSGGLTPLYMQCAAELLAQTNSESEVVQLLRRLAGEDLLPQGLLESPTNGSFRS